MTARQALTYLGGNLISVQFKWKIPCIINQNYQTQADPTGRPRDLITHLGVVHIEVPLGEHQGCDGQQEQEHRQVL